jgi:hypothetical protein
MRYDEPRLVWTRLTTEECVCLLLQDLVQRCLQEWPKSAPFFFSATVLAVLNPFFFGGVQMEFSV